MRPQPIFDLASAVNIFPIGISHFFFFGLVVHEMLNWLVATRLYLGQLTIRNTCTTKEHTARSYGPRSAVFSWRLDCDFGEPRAIEVELWWRFFFKFDPGSPIKV